PPATTGTAFGAAAACPTANPPTSEPAAANAAVQRTNPILIVRPSLTEAPSVRPPVPTMTSVRFDRELTQVSANKSSGLGQVRERSVKVRDRFVRHAPSP